MSNAARFSVSIELIFRKNVKTMVLHESSPCTLGCDAILDEEVSVIYLGMKSGFFVSQKLAICSSTAFEPLISSLHVCVKWLLNSCIFNEQNSS